MSECLFRRFIESDQAYLEKALVQFYREGAGFGPIAVEHIRRTIQYFQTDPDQGSLWIAEREAVPIGYAIVVAYWSNELGGLVMVLDEFFLEPRARNAGVGSAFLRFMEAEYRRRGFVAAALEVLPGNARARRFYKRLGYRLYKNQPMLKPL